jgi:hypothetical protein
MLRFPSSVFRSGCSSRLQRSDHAEGDEYSVPSAPRSCPSTVMDATNVCARVTRRARHERPRCRASRGRSQSDTGQLQPLHSMARSFAAARALSRYFRNALPSPGSTMPAASSSRSTARRGCALPLSRPGAGPAPLAPPLGFAPGGLRFFAGASDRWLRCCAAHRSLLSASLWRTRERRERFTCAARSSHAPRRWVIVEQRKHALRVRRVHRLCGWL